MTEPEQNNNNTAKEDDFKELNKLRDKFMPWRREIMIVGILILIALVVFLGFAYGGMKVCSELDGILDDKFKCHPNYTNTLDDGVNNVGQKFVVPRLEDIER